jgi:hypothetical protein
VLETRSRVDVALRCLCPSEASLARRRWTRGRKRYTDEAHKRAHASAVWAAVVVVVCGREGGRNRGGGRGVQGGGSGGLLCDDDDEPPPIPSHLIPNPPSRKPLLLLKSVLAATVGPRCFCPTKTLSRAKHCNKFFTTPHHSSLPSLDNPPARPRSIRYTALATMHYRAGRARSH